MRALWIPVLIPVLVLSAYLGWSWYQVKHVMDELIKDAAPYATLSYESIPLAFKGEYTVKGLTIDPLDSGVLLSIDQAKLVVDDWQTMFLQGTPFEKGDFPNAMSLSLSGFSFDTQARSDSQPMMAILLEQPVLQGCVKSNGQPVVMRDLSMGVINSDMTFDYRFNPENQIANVNVATSMAKLGAASVGIDFEIGRDKLNKQALQLNPPQLLSISLDSQDQGYNQVLLDRCVSGSGMSLDEFAQANIEMMQAEFLPLGLNVPEPLIELYPELLKPGATLQVALDFVHPIPLTGAPAIMGDVELFNLIDLKVSVNNKKLDVTEMLQAMIQQAQEGALSAVPNLEEVETPKGGFVNESKSAIVKEESEPLALFKPRVNAVVEEQKEEKVVVKKEKRPEFVTLAINQIDRSLEGKTIKADTFNGHRVEGQVIKVFNNRMLLRQQIGTGTAEIPLMFKHLMRMQIKQ